MISGVKFISSEEINYSNSKHESLDVINSRASYNRYEDNCVVSYVIDVTPEIAEIVTELIKYKFGKTPFYPKYSIVWSNQTCILKETSSDDIKNDSLRFWKVLSKLAENESDS